MTRMNRPGTSKSIIIVESDDVDIVKVGSEENSNYTDTSVMRLGSEDASS